MAGVDPKAAANAGVGADAGESDGADAIDELEAAGDVEALLEAARAYRSGKDVPRDLGACFRAYDAAARLGSAEGSYGSALFFLRGGVVPEDGREAIARLRAAADGGSVPAKVYLANMYEAGVHVRADREKADVWLRSIARSANVDAPAGTADYARAMADLGVARYAIQLADAAATPAEADALRKKAAAFGWRAPKTGTGEATSAGAREGGTEASAAAPLASARAKPATPTATAAARLRDDAEGAPEHAEPVARAALAAKKRAAIDEELAAEALLDAEEEENARRRRGAAPRVQTHSGGIQWRSGLTRFVFAAMFAAAAIGAGHLLTQGAALLVARGQPVPLVGAAHVERIWPIALAVVAGVPSLLLYGFAQVLRALVVAAVAGVGGALLWGQPHVTLLSNAQSQGVAFALGGFLAGLLVFGLVVPTRPKRSAAAGPFKAP